MKSEIKRTYKTTTLVMLVFNEIEAIKELYPSIPFESVTETFVVDGGSKDGTIEFLRDKGLKVIIQEKKGRGNAFIEAIPHIKTDNVIYFSGDGNENPADIPKMRYHLNNGYDLVIAARFLIKNSKFDTSDDPFRFRKFGSIIISTIARVLWKTKTKDALNGFRGFKTESLKRLKLDAPKHEIEIQSTIRVSRLGMKIFEFPTTEMERLGGSRSVTAGTFRMAFNILWYIFKELFKKIK